MFVVSLFKPALSVIIRFILEGSLQQEEQSRNNNIKGCILPWNHIFGGLLGNYHLCCHAEYQESAPILGPASHSISQVWNAEPLKKVRKQFLKGDMPAVCKKVCYDREAIGVKSNRISVNERFENQKHLQDRTEKDGSLPSMPTYMDIRFGNLCNFKCRMCGPESSTSWYKDSKLSFSKTIDPYTKNNALWEDMPNIIPHLTDVYFAGGEPFVQDGHYKLLQLLIDSGYCKDIKLQYNTNLSYTKYKKFNLLEMWKNFLDVSVWPSIEGFESKAEYSRKGLNWNTFKYNVDHYKQHIKTFSSVISIFSITSMPDLIIWFKKNRMAYNGTLLTNPIECSITCLPNETKKLIIQAYKKFIKKYTPILNRTDIEQMKEWLTYMTSRDDTHLLKRFKKEQERLDFLRNESFIDTFPEYATWYKNILV